MRFLAGFAVVGTLLALGAVSAAALPSAGAGGPIDGTYRGTHLFKIAGSLEGGFTISAGESWMVFGCPVSAGTVLQRFTPKGGSQYELRWMTVYATTTQGQEGVKCEYIWDGGPVTVTVTAGKTSLTVSGCGTQCLGTGGELKRATSTPPTTTTKPKQPPKPPANWQKLTLTYEMPARLVKKKNGVIDYLTHSYEVDPDEWTALVTVRWPGGGGCAGTYKWTIGGKANRFVQMKDPKTRKPGCTFAFHKFPENNKTYRVNVRAERDGQHGVGETMVTIKDLLIVGLGDSNGSGEGNPDVPGTFRPLWGNVRCDRSAKSYQALAAIALENASPKTSVTFVHLACSGASIDKGLLGSYAGINNPGGRPLPPQLEKMRDLISGRKPDAVIVSIGINDLGFGPLVLFCLEQNACFAKRGFQGAKQELNDVIGGRIAGLAAKYGRVAARLGVDPKSVYITEYPDPTHDSNGKVCDPLMRVYTKGTFTQGEADWAYDEVLIPLNRAVAATSHLGWHVVTGSRQLFRRHGYCSDNSWIVPLTDSLLNQAAKEGAMHANATGHQIQARLVLAALKRNGVTGKP